MENNFDQKKKGTEVSDEDLHKVIAIIKTKETDPQVAAMVQDILFAE